MAGAWAAALVSIAGALRLAVKAGGAAVRAAVADELRKLWSELESQDQHYHEEIVELRDEVRSLSREFRPNGGASVRDQLDRLELMLQAHVAGEG